MNEVKTAFVEALEKSAAALSSVVGSTKLPEPHDSAGQRRVMADKNFGAKLALAPLVEGFASWPQKLRAGEWPYFRPDSAQDAIETIERMVAIAASKNAEGGFVEAVVQALQPLRNVVEKYANETAEGWRFPEEMADEPPPMPEIPPDPSIRPA